MLYLAKRAKGEVGGFDLPERAENSPTGARELYYTMRVATLPKQDVEASIFDPSPFELLEFIDANCERPQKNADTVALWWHSHANLPTSPSYRDHKTIDNLTTLGYIVITLIINKRGEHSCRMDFDLDGIPLAYKMKVVTLVPPFFNKEQRDALDAEFDVQVTEWTTKDPRPSTAQRVRKVATGNDRIAKAAREALRDPDDDEDAAALGMSKRSGVAGYMTYDKRHGYPHTSSARAAALAFVKERDEARTLMGGIPRTEADVNNGKANTTRVPKNKYSICNSSGCFEQLTYQAELDAGLCIACMDENDDDRLAEIISTHSGWLT